MAPIPPLGRADKLNAEITEYVVYSKKWAVIVGTLYYVLRAALIVMSACTAAKGIPFVTSNVELLALLVAIGTAVDTWLKTGTRYKAHYVYNDKFIALQTDLELTDPGDNAAIDKVKETFKKLIDDYAIAVLPS